jgi:ABC-type phosphate/phosphonate transport system substrate-binding protein
VAVLEGDADIAALDAVTFALLQRHRAEAQGTRVLLSTPETPGLPLITCRGGPAGALFAALAEAIETVGSELREALLLRGLVPRSDCDFDGIAADDARASALP